MIELEVNWTVLKNFIIDRNLPLNWFDFNGNYFIKALDGGLSLSTVLSQHDPNDSDLQDFENNYKNSGNVPLSTRSLQGSTVVYSGTAGTSPSNIPSTADKIISSFGLRNIGTTDILISMDAGTTFFTIPKNGFFSWEVKGPIDQLIVKTLSLSSDYEIVVNFKEV